MSHADFRAALRRLARSRGYAAAVIVLLGLAFGANAGVFSVIYGLLYKPLPFAQSERLVTLETHVMGLPQNTGLSAAYLKQIADHSVTLEGATGYRIDNVGVRDDDRRKIGSLRVSRMQPGGFTVLGTTPALGRLLVAEDAEAGAARSLVLSWDEWQQRYAGATGVLGRLLKLDDGDYRIVGVAARGFHFPWRDIQAFLPLGFTEAERSAHFAGNFDGLFGFARLRGDATSRAAAAELGELARTTPGLGSVFAVSQPSRADVRSLRMLWLGERQGALELMLLAVAMVLLVTIANVCNLAIARQLGRRHETAVSAALGAGAWQRLRQTLAEALLLCGAGALLGLALFPAMLALLRHFELMPTQAPQAIGMDAITFVLIAALALLVSAILTASATWLQRGNLHALIRQGSSRQTASRAAQRLRNGLIVTQIAMTAALLVGIGLLLRSSQELLAEDVGFTRDHLVIAVFGESTPADTTDPVRKTRLRSVIEQAKALPGVVAVGVGNDVPFGGGGTFNDFTPPGRDDGVKEPANSVFVDENYFSTLGARIVRGRGFTADEARTRAMVAIVDASFAQRYLGDADPIGQRIRKDEAGQVQELTIVGVVAAIKRQSLDEQAERVTLYQPNQYPQFPALLLRTNTAPEALLPPLRALFPSTDTPASTARIFVMDERIAESLKDRNRVNRLLQLLGVIALGLAAVGLYAVLAYAVNQRNAEFGIRMALGANAARVHRSVLGQGLRLVAGGLLLAMPLAWMTSNALSSRLYQVGAFDPPTLAAVAALFGAIGLATCWWPARRAAGTDPAVALRNE